MTLVSKMYECTNCGSTRRIPTHHYYDVSTNDRDVLCACVEERGGYTVWHCTDQSPSDKVFLKTGIHPNDLESIEKRRT